ncbi:cell division protein FtsW [Gallaecimonas xiamenensis]|uniref:Probable peptidoglycan glycosyltransferase FtsW n=1 Tax=Gallaecimonas xiamenensis 3-C-1 TaxID=745411 RepID=K2J9E1_9GAMM|nr:cell division protein FtsW [Gallaecimonas xiamenensis]EKE71452.1 cell division protein FtsW [Gallaecimonas xiamenensis 3-C-1]
MIAALRERFFAEKAPQTALYDKPLLMVIFSLMAFGWVMIASASMPEATRLTGNPFYIINKETIFVVGALVLAVITLQVPIHVWARYNGYLLLLALGLLLAVLVVGRNVNGATRWIAFGPINLQAAEPAKLFLFAYLAGYLVRRHQEVRENLVGFLKPLGVFFLMALFLLAQPDLGTVVVMLVTTLGLLFLAGARVWQFIGMIIMGVAALVLLIVMEPYRMKRVTGFLDPWADPFGTGYQLTQSLMAFGRGGLTGQGLGNSILKMEYLPEAHTDFIMAVVAEELGFLAIVALMAVIFWVVLRALRIGRDAMANERFFEGFFAYAIAIWVAFQTAVNLGVAAGAFPTKGLTMPLVSYGGSSLWIMTIALMVLVRIDHEGRLAGQQASGGRS